MTFAAGDPGIGWLDDYQFQIEHWLNLVGRRRVLFVEASLDCRAPFEVKPVNAATRVSAATRDRRRRC